MPNKLLTGGTVLQLGGNVRNKGWHNISLNGKNRKFEDGTVFVHHNLTLGIPAANESYEMIYSSHFLEHVSTEDGFFVLNEAYRVLEPGGKIRLSMPDSESIIKAYINNDYEFLNDHEVNYPKGLPPSNICSPIDHIVRASSAWGHVTMYDLSKAERLLKGSGFCNIKKSSFNQDFDPEKRRGVSFYIIAEKPRLVGR